MSSSNTAPETTSDINQLSVDVSNLNITDNTESNELISNESNTTNTLTTGTVNTYRWADELDDTDSSFSQSDSDDTQVDSEDEERGHTKYVVKLTNLAKNTTIKQIKEIIPKELQVYHITFDSNDNTSALVSFDNDKHMLKALQYSGKITAPNTGSSNTSSSKNKDTSIYIDPWEDPSTSKNYKNPAITPISMIKRNKFTGNIYKSNSERIIRHDTGASNDKGHEFNSARSLKDEPRPTTGERQKLVLKPRSKPLTLEIPPLPKISEHENLQSSIAARKGPSESTESTKATNTQIIQKKKSVDKAVECNLDAIVDNAPKEQVKKSYDKKYKVERFEKSEKYERSERVDNRGERSERVERIEKHEKHERGERSERIERVERVERTDKEKSEKYERIERTERTERGERSDRSERTERHVRRERHSDKYERLENTDKPRISKSGRYSKEGGELKTYPKEHSKDYNAEHRKDSNVHEEEFNRKNSVNYTKSHTIGIPKDALTVQSGKYVKKRVDSPLIEGDSYNQSHKQGSISQEVKNSGEDGKGSGRFAEPKTDKINRQNSEKKTPRSARRKNVVDESSASVNPGNKPVNTDDKKGKNISHVVKPTRNKRQPVN